MSNGKPEKDPGYFLFPPALLIREFPFYSALPLALNQSSQYLAIGWCGFDIHNIRHTLRGPLQQARVVRENLLIRPIEQNPSRRADDVHLLDYTMSANSQARSDRGRALLSKALGSLVGQPLVKMQSVEQLMASQNSTTPPMPDMPEEERRAIIHDSLDRHYRNLLDQPIPMLARLIRQRAPERLASVV
jgi:hypothetical protein